MNNRSWWHNYGIYPYLLVKIVFIIGIIALIIYLLELLQVVVIPILLALILAYIGHGVVDALEKRRIPRSIGAGVMVIIYIALLTGIAFAIIPYLINQIGTLISRLPDMLKVFIAKIGPFLQHISPNAKFDANTVLRMAKSYLPQMAAPTKWMVTNVFSSAMTFFMVVFNLVIMVVFTYYMLRDYHEVINRIADLIPRRHLDKATMIAKTIDGVLTGFIHGQITVSLVLALIYGISLALTGLEMGFTIGIIAGICNFVPYMATIVGVSLSSLAIVVNYHGLGQLIAVAAVFAAVPLLDAAFLTPHIVGPKVGLNPFIVIVALLIGAQLLGILGVLLAVPTAAVIKALLVIGIDAYKKSSFYQDEN